MKLNITIDLDTDFLYYDEFEECYKLKDDNTFMDEIKDYIKGRIADDVSWNIDKQDVLDRVSVVIVDNKDAIIEKVVNRVSDKIIKSKKIKDFKKSLDEE